jgi:cysteine-rich repeat protein
VNNNCSVVCGDGLLANSEECDDGNLADGDGCDSLCKVEAAFFCEGTIGNASNCSQCPAGCLNCSSDVNCALCDSLFLLSNATCLADCSLIDNCTSCEVSSGQTQCLGCELGYQPAVPTVCSPVCGDGLLRGAEECDDDNTLSGDGCSGQCLIEDGFACQTAAGNQSNCSQCVGATYQSANKTVCAPCVNYDCGTCDISGNCTSCNSSSNRQMDNVSNRCVPMDGYYDDGASLFAPACHPECLTCNGNSSLDCLSCGTGLILNGTECLSCSDVAATGCSACYDNGTEYICTACSGSTLSSGTCVFDSSSS